LPCGYSRKRTHEAIRGGHGYEYIDMLVIAHAGHWIIGVANFVPVLGFLVWLGFTRLKERRSERKKG
jgi:hypothetical protein